MPTTKMRYSDLTTASVLNDDDILALAKVDQASASGYMSYKATMIAIGLYITKLATYTSDLQTTNKTIIGAINELKQLIALIPQFDIEVVEQLPTEDISETTIYMVPSQNPETENAYDEFIYVDDEWEQVGSTVVDLSAYYTKLEVDGLLDLKESKADMEEDVTEILEDLSDDVTVTGNPVTFETINGGMAKSCEVTMLPIQSGTGDPSPTNIRPISGRDSVNLTRTGKNLFNPTPYSSYIQSDGRYKLTGTQSVAIVINIPSYLVGKQLTFSAYLDLSEGRTPTNCKCLATVNGTNIVGNAIDSGNKGISSVTFTPQSTNDSFRITYGSNPSNYFYFSNPQLELGSTATAFEPYNGQTHTATFPDTVYGGSYDFVSGEGQSKVAKVTFDGSENWIYSSSGGGRYQIVSVGLPANSQVACNILKPVNEQATGNVYISNSGNLLCYVPDASEENLTAWTNYLSNTNMELAYELATPTEITLTAEQIELLKGTNVVSTDGDNIKLMASKLANVPDLLTYIQSLEARIKALEEA